jgi:hypothetical protein
MVHHKQHTRYIKVHGAEQLLLHANTLCCTFGPREGEARPPVRCVHAHLDPAETESKGDEQRSRTEYFELVYRQLLGEVSASDKPRAYQIWSYQYQLWASGHGRLALYLI